YAKPPPILSFLLGINAERLPTAAKGAGLDTAPRPQINSGSLPGEWFSAAPPQDPRCGPRCPSNARQSERGRQRRWRYTGIERTGRVAFPTDRRGLAGETFC